MKARYPYGYWRDIRRFTGELMVAGIDQSVTPEDFQERGVADEHGQAYSLYRRATDYWLYDLLATDAVPRTTVVSVWMGKFKASGVVRDALCQLTVDTFVGGFQGKKPDTGVFQRSNFYYEWRQIGSVAFAHNLRVINDMVTLPTPNGYEPTTQRVKWRGSTHAPSQLDANHFYDYLEFGASGQYRFRPPEDAGPGQSPEGAQQ
jgi:hypothetical protein